MRQVVTGTLAWAGLVVVVAVPSAEAVLSRLVHPTTAPYVQPAAMAVTTPPAAIVPKPAAVPSLTGTTAAIKQAAVTRPVFVSTSAVAPAATPQVVAKAAPELDVAAAGESGAMPAASADDVVSAPAAPVKESGAGLPHDRVGVAEVGPTTGQNGVQVATSPAAGSGLTDGIESRPAPPPVPMPAADRPKAPPVRVITADELRGWKSGSLADYLRQQNLADAGNSAPDGQN